MAMAADRKPRNPFPWVHGLAGLGYYSSLSFQVAAAVGVGFALGWWLDRKMGTTPILAILGMLMGGVAGFVNVYRLAMAEIASQQRKRAAPRGYGTAASAATAAGEAAARGADAASNAEDGQGGHGRSGGHSDD